MWRLGVAFCALLSPVVPPRGNPAWTARDVPAAVSAIAADPFAEETLYAGSKTGAVFRSTNAGVTWNTLPLAALSSVRSIAVDPGSSSRLYVSGNLASGRNGLFVTSDGGLTWRASDLPAPFEVTEVAAPPSGSAVFALAFTCPSPGLQSCRFSLFKSGNGGANWSRLGIEVSGDSLGPLAADPTNSLALYLGSQRGLYKSSDGGATWSLLQVPALNACGYVTAVEVAPSSVVFAAATTVTLLRYVCSGIYRGREAGAAFSGPRATGELVTAFAFDPRASGTGYAGASRANPNGPVSLLRTTDGGDSWHSFDSGLGSEKVLRLTISRGGRFLHALTSDGRLYTLDLLPAANPNEGLRRSPRLVPGRPS